MDEENWGDEDDEFERRLAFNRDVSDEVRRLRVRKAAKERVAAEEAAQAGAEPVDVATLAEVLARPAEPPMRAEGLIPSAASVLVSAKRKAGKTTFGLNLSRCLITGEDFLGRFPIRPIRDGARVGYLNYEVSGATLARWADEAGVPHDRLVVVNVRGRRNPLADPDDRYKLAQQLRDLDVEVLIADPFGRAFTGMSQNDAGEVTSWLVMLDTFARTEVGASELILLAHAGWNGERTRGSSALEDWADVIVTLTTDEDEQNRFLKALGRDVEVDEDRLDYDPATRMLTLSGSGSRKQARQDQQLSELAVYVVRAAGENPGASVAALERAIKCMDDGPETLTNGLVSKAAKWARDHGHLTILSGGPGRPSKHFAINPSDLSDTPPTDDPATPPTPPYMSEGLQRRGSVPDRSEQIEDAS